MDAYNPALDTVSDGANQARAWKDYKASGTAGEQNQKKTLGEDMVEAQKKEYGKHYPSVWTKDPHGGQYRIDKGPGARKGYDALEQKSDGTIIKRAPGYEKPQSGPTTNFVGNHMTQGAIDLVQYELTKLDPEGETRKVRLERARGIVRKSPELVSVSMEEEPARNENICIDKFTWWDAEESIELIIKRSTLADGAWADSTLECSDTDATVSIPKVTSSLIAQQVYVLKLTRLYKSILPEKCTHVVDHDGLRLKLVKSDSSVRWTSLQAPVVQALPPNTELLSKRNPSDLRDLRARLIADREGKLASTMGWLVPSSIKNSDEPDMRAFTSALIALERAQVHFDVGDYVTVLSVVVLGLRDPNISCGEKCELLNLRARANVQLGALKDAVDDYSRIIDTEFSVGMLFKRASVLEQLEDYNRAVIDYEGIIKIDSGDSNAHQALKRARECAATKMRMEEIEKKRGAESGNMFQSIPRPCLPQFENRGKAGACF